jgi:hypothetical protein
MSFELLKVALELLAMLEASLELLVTSLELLISAAEELMVSFEDEVGSVIEGASAMDDEDNVVSLEGVVCSPISAFSALEEVSEEQAAKKMAALVHRTKCLKLKENMAKFLKNRQFCTIL